MKRPTDVQDFLDTVYANDGDLYACAAFYGVTHNTVICWVKYFKVEKEVVSARHPMDGAAIRCIKKAIRNGSSYDARFWLERSDKLKAGIDDQPVPRERIDLANKRGNHD